jgi:MoaA/NifB/PqqE/SkfB family radical SAM enzyme
MMGQVYAANKFTAFPDRLDALRTRRMAAPVHVRIKPINRCNHDCWYCAYRTDALTLGEGMNLGDALPKAKMMEIADDLIEMGVRAVTFSGGGEPLLYKPLPDVIGRLAAGGIRVATLTNGANLKGRMADAFARHGTWVRVSMDGGDDDSYCRNRGAKPGEFTRIVENLRAFAARGSQCVLGVIFIVTEENVGQVFDTCRLLKEIGVHHVKLSAAVVANEAGGNTGYHDRMASQARAEVERAKALAGPRFDVIDHYHEIAPRFERAYHSCPSAVYLTVIGADAGVYTCQDKAYTETGLLGSIRERRFKDFWFSDETRERLYGLDPSRACRHHCVAHAKNLAIFEQLALDPDHLCFV